MVYSRQEYWSGLPFPPPGHLPEMITKKADVFKGIEHFTCLSPDLGSTRLIGTVHKWC